MNRELPMQPDEGKIAVRALLQAIHEELEKVDVERKKWGYASDGNCYACVRAIDRISDSFRRLQQGRRSIEESKDPSSVSIDNN